MCKGYYLPIKREQKHFIVTDASIYWAFTLNRLYSLLLKYVLEKVILLLTTDLNKVLNFTEGSKRVAQIGTDLETQSTNFPQLFLSYAML